MSFIRFTSESSDPSRSRNWLPLAQAFPLLVLDSPYRCCDYVARVDSERTLLIKGALLLERDRWVTRVPFQPDG